MELLYTFFDSPSVKYSRLSLTLALVLSLSIYNPDNVTGIEMEYVWAACGEAFCEQESSDVHLASKSSKGQ